MELEIKPRTTVLEKVSFGAVFSYRGELYIKTNDEDGALLGVRLKDGWCHYGLYDDFPVTLVSGKFITD